MKNQIGFLMIVMALLLSSCTPAVPTLERENVATSTATLAPTAIPPSPTPDLRVGGFIIEDGIVYLAADDGAKTRQELGDVRVFQLAEVNGIVTAFAEDGTTPLANFVDGQWLEVVEYLTPEQLVDMPEAEKLTYAPEGGSYVFKDRFVAYGADLQHPDHFYDLTTGETLTREAVGFWTFEYWKEKVFVGTEILDDNKPYNLDLIFEERISSVLSSVEEIKALEETTPLFTFNPDGGITIGLTPTAAIEKFGHGATVRKSNYPGLKVIGAYSLLAANGVYRGGNHDVYVEFVAGKNRHGIVMKISKYILTEVDSTGRVISPVMRKPAYFWATNGGGERTWLEGMDDPIYWLEAMLAAHYQGIVIEFTSN
jgi:hypothetical protein